MNFVLRSDPTVSRLSLQTGQTTRGDGQSVRADWTGGRALGRAADGRAGFAVLTAEVRHREPTQRVGGGTATCTPATCSTSATSGPNGEYASEAEYQEDLRRSASAASTCSTCSASATRACSTARSSSTPPRRSPARASSATAPRCTPSAVPRTGAARATAFFRQPADVAQAVPSRYPDGYLPRIESDIQDGSLALGVRGQRGAWRYDLGTAAGVDRFGFGVRNTANPSLGATTPTEFDAGALRYASNTLRLDLARPVAGALASGAPRGNLAVGAEWRLEGYGITAGEEASWRDYGRGVEGAAGGSRGFPGFQPANAGSWTRDNVGAWADAELNVTGALLVSGAVRAERYSDFGGRATGKLAGLLRLGERAALRGAFNTGFRAPSLHQVHTSKLSSIFVNNREVVSGLFANDDPVARALGVAPLRAETSRNWSGGLVVEPVRRLTVQVDGYRIDVDDRIAASGVLGRGDVPAVTPRSPASPTWAPCSSSPTPSTRAPRASTRR
jgi:iron complex outermembrane receptor protein